MKNLLTKILSVLMALILVFGIFDNVYADPDPEAEGESTSEATTFSLETTASAADNQIVVSTEDAKTAFLNETNPEAPEINGKSFVLFDAQSQVYLYGQDINLALEPASTTKLMTVLLALENCDMSDTVTITPMMFNGIPEDYVRLGMTEGEEFTVEALINAAILKSCNDATLALAIHIGGTEADFCTLMNEKAKELGCTNTNFTSSYGLSDPDRPNLTTVSDMCKILEACLAYPDFSEIATSTQYEIPETNKYNDKRTILNANRFISTQMYAYEYYIGGKTGFTEAAGNTIVAAANKNGRILIAAIFGAEDSEIRYSDIIKLFEYGYNKFTTAAIDEADYTTLKDNTEVQITQLLVDTDLKIVDYSINLNPYHTTLTSRALGGYTAVIELSGVIIDPNVTSQSFDIPLYRRYNDNYTYEVGTIHLLIESKERLSEITPEKSSSKFWGKLKNIIITVLGISGLAVILIAAIFIFRRRNIKRKDRNFRNKSKML